MCEVVPCTPLLTFVAVMDLSLQHYNQMFMFHTTTALGTGTSSLSLTHTHTHIVIRLALVDFLHSMCSLIFKLKPLIRVWQPWSVCVCVCFIGFILQGLDLMCDIYISIFLVCSLCSSHTDSTKVKGKT